MSYFSFQNKRIYYNEFGAGAPLVFLHGNTASSNMFAEAVMKYAESFRVVLIDFLGHGKSDRLLEEFPADLWFYEAQQAAALLREKQYTDVNLIGSSGVALAAINVALESPGLVKKVIADSFEGERPLKAFTKNIKRDRELSKRDEGARMFYYYMHGGDWEQVVDNDTSAVMKHDNEIGVFFHKPLQELKAEILFTGSKEDEFTCAMDSDFFENTYGGLVQKIGHGQIHIFPGGRHPAMLSNPKDFYRVSMEFLKP